MTHRIENALFQFFLSIAVTTPVLVVAHAQWWCYAIMLVSASLTASWFLKERA